MTTAKIISKPDITVDTAVLSLVSFSYHHPTFSFSDEAHLISWQNQEIQRLEAKMRDLYGADHILSCAYCGEPYPVNTPASGETVTVLTEHIAQCKKHPMNAMSAELVALRREVAELRRGGGKAE